MASVSGGATWLWIAVLLAAVWAAHWGAEHLGQPLKKIRRQLGITEVAGAAFVGLAAASAEIGISATSALRGVSDIGLGATLGSNTLALPLGVTVAYFAMRRLKAAHGQPQRAGAASGVIGPVKPRAIRVQQPQTREAKKQGERLAVEQRHAVAVQVIPYLVIVTLVAALTLPARWRGLQPPDGFALLVAYIAYLVQALRRERGEREQVTWSRHEIYWTLAGLAALAGGAYFTVLATENLVNAFGISKIIGGLFMTAPMACLPEIFAIWSVTRSGQFTAATSSVIGDHAVTLTLALIPLALVGAPVGSLQLYSVVLGFVALMPALYGAILYWGDQTHGFTYRQVLLLAGAYLLFVGLVVFWVQ
ncbi:MAG TPA: hypothetical protein VNK95_01965 [Caldilineaceae bacterium]|nr:hypothetical protein [Caldilineaceae bacterium]